jgi:polar amino acid transport system substrate-binding protein
MHKRSRFISLVLALVLVTTASVVVAAPLGQQGQEYVIQKGDTLTALAEKYIGKTDDVIAILAGTSEKAATDETFAKINDPALVEHGMKIWIPDKTEAAKYTAPLPDLKGQKLKVGSDITYPPFEFPDKTSGVATGFDIEMVKDLCVRLNCAPDFVATAYDGIFVALAAKEFDMVVSGSTITAERAKIVDFSYPYMVYGQILLLRSADAKKFATADAAKGKPIGSQLGTTNEKTAVDKFGDANVKRYDTFDLAVVALLNGDVDGVVIDLPSAVGFMEQYPGKLVAGPDLTTGEALGMVFQKGDTAIEPAFDAALVRFKADGTYAKLYDKWFNVSAKAAAASGTPAPSGTPKP